MKNKVMIAVPSADLIHARFVSSLINLLGMSASLPDTKIFYCNYIGSRIAENRNGLVKVAQEQGHTHILFIDADMTFPPEGLGELLSHDKDIVGATACKRQEGGEKAIGVTLKHKTEDRLVKMETMGLPFTLIKMDVFNRMSKPYFAEPFDTHGELIAEDTYFYKACLRAEFDIWCDSLLSLKMGHLGVKEYRIKAESGPNHRRD